MNKSKKIKQLRNENGITLIALVITIIILIILAGVSINILIDNDGLMNKVKQAAENMEIAKVEEQEMLNTLLDSIENAGQIKTIEEMRTLGTYMPSKITLKDSDGNLIKVPEGFKIASDSGLSVTEGIVIEDKDIKEGIGNNRGNQYVWIPVGENIKKSDGTEIDITLGRYVFADGTNHKDEEGTVLAPGTPILKQSAENYEDETEINMKEIKPTTSLEYEYKELKTKRDGVASSGVDGLNATALNLKGFIESSKANGGYYIARYEASYGTDGKANSKVSSDPNNSSNAPTQEGHLWNNITQINAAMASRNLYNVGGKVTINSDLINSYAWDTTIVYIQAFSQHTNYSCQDGKSICSSLSNTGNLAEGAKDEECKINNMASNTYEWTTEYCTNINTNTSSALSCTDRGGVYDRDTIYMNSRGSGNTSASGKYCTFRSILYI